MEKYLYSIEFWFIVSFCLAAFLGCLAAAADELMQIRSKLPR